MFFMEISIFSPWKVFVLKPHPGNFAVLSALCYVKVSLYPKTLLEIITLKCVYKINMIFVLL